MENPEGKIDPQVEHHHQQPELLLSGGRVWILIVLAILVAASAYSLIRLSSADNQRAELIRTNQALQSSLDQAKSQLQSASEQLSAANARSQAAQLPAPAVQAEPISGSAQDNQALGQPIHRTKTAQVNHLTSTAHKMVVHRADDPRWSAMDAKLAEQQKQIESTKSDIEKTRTDLEGSLGSTRDELNGSIARTHDEVVELRKRGERNYYEFNLNKSSNFDRTGPLSLSLRKANVKRKYYDIALIVDDQKIEKKHVNLYEPLWISVPDRPEPVQVIVNSISKDNVKGYLSEPKYKKSELASAQSAKAVQPASNPPASQTGEGDPDTGAGPLKPR